MQRANNLYKQKIHPTNIITGYKIAMKECVKYIKENLKIPGNDINDEILIHCAKVYFIFYIYRLQCHQRLLVVKVISFQKWLLIV